MIDADLRARERRGELEPRHACRVSGHEPIRSVRQGPFLQHDSLWSLQRGLDLSDQTIVVEFRPPEALPGGGWACECSRCGQPFEVECARPCPGAIVMRWERGEVYCCSPARVGQRGEGAGCGARWHDLWRVD